MEILPHDIIREIFSYLDPYDYRALRQVSRTFLRLSRIPLRNYLIYSGVIGAYIWIMKVDRLGNCLGVIMSVHNITLVDLIDGHLLIQSRNTVHGPCKINSAGYLVGKFNVSYVGDPKDNPSGVSGSYRSLLEGKCHGTIVEFSCPDNIPGMSYRKVIHSTRYRKGVPECKELSFSANDFILIYNKEFKLRFLEDSRAGIRITREGNIYKDGKRYFLESDELYYLPEYLSSKKIPIKGNNLEEIILPLRLTNCWSNQKAKEDLRTLCHRVIFFLMGKSKE